jgi:hypothetical protein
MKDDINYRFIIILIAMFLISQSFANQQNKKTIKRSLDLLELSIQSISHNKTLGYE